MAALVKIISEKLPLTVNESIGSNDSIYKHKRFQVKKKILILTVFFITIVMQMYAQLVVDPNASVRELAGNYNSIQVSDGIDLYLSQSSDLALAVSAVNEEIKNGIKTVIDNGTLRIYYDGTKSMRKKHRNLRVYVSFKELQKIKATGASEVVVVGNLTGADLRIEMSGACEFKGHVKLKSLKVNLSGASDMHISGTADTVDIESAGASDVHGFDLVTDYCTADATGASDINITVNKEIRAKATGASDIKVRGDGQIKQNQSSGASSIEKKN